MKEIYKLLIDNGWSPEVIDHFIKAEEIIPDIKTTSYIVDIKSTYYDSDKAVVVPDLITTSSSKTSLL